jgi:glucuronoarabinoxylan endo-1,4-beta-xylanase
VVSAFLSGAIQIIQASSSSVTFEAESGMLGAEFTNGVSGAVEFISISTTNQNSGNPGSAERVATYTVTFPAAGTYQLYARIRVGPDAGNDDSLFYADSFGEKSPTTDGDWFLANGIGGFNNSTDVVTGGGTTTSGVWKWINLSQKVGHVGLSVSAGSLTQTFQIGARENGLDMDKFVFGMNGITYTVADLDGDLPGTLPDGSTRLNWADTRQLIDGFGAGVVFLNGGAVFNDANADKLFKMDTTNQLGLTLLRVRIEPNGSWTNSVSGWSGSVNDAKRGAIRGAGVLASPWTPPAYMKSTTNTVGGILLPEHYAGYAAYLEKYSSNMLANGVSLSAVSVQNEPDWDPDYEGCVWSGSQLLNFFRTNAHVIKSAPVMMPESLGFNFNLSDPSLNDSVAVTNIDFIGGHLYGVPEVNGVRNITPYNNALNKGKRVWQTEYLINDQSMETAILTAQEIHNCLTRGSMSAYIWWKCVSTQNGLLNDSGVIQRRGFVMSQFSRFVRPGHYRMGETNSGSGTVSAYKNPANGQFAIIAINPYAIAFDQQITLTNFPSPVTLVPWITSATYSLATLPSIDVTNGSFNYSLPPNSIITFVGQAVFGPPGVASNPSPVNGATGVAVGSALNWTPGSNAVAHAVYLGTISNSVAQATPASPEFQGEVSMASFVPSLVGSQTYYWRVDEIAGANTNAGPVWSFATAAPSVSFILNANDANGATTSFNGIGNWVTNGPGGAATTPPNAAYAYFTGTRLMRTPQGSSSGTFGGASLTLNAPAAQLASVNFKSLNNATFTFNNLILAGGGLANGGDAANNSADTVQNVAGNINVLSNGWVSISAGATRTRTFGISANLSGSGTLTNSGGGAGNVTYTGNNSAFTGQLYVNDFAYDQPSSNFGPTTVRAASQQNLGGAGAKLVLDNGVFQPTASFALNNPGGNLTLNAGGGILQIGAGLTLTLSNPVVGIGSLRSSGGGTLQVAGANTATGSLSISNSTLAVLGGATFQNSQLGISNTATLDVRAMTVPLAVSNRITLAGSLLSAIDKTGFTTLLAASNVTYGGTLTLSNEGPALAYGDTIKLFNASNYAGAFSSILPATPGTGLVWNTNWLGVDGTVFVSASDVGLITPPHITGIERAGDTLIMTGTNGNAPGTYYYTLSTTDIAVPLAGWTIVATNPFGPGGAFSCTNNIDASEPQRYFILRQP